MGAKLYIVRIGIVLVSPKRWSANLPGLLRLDRLARGAVAGQARERVMDRVCRKGDGFVPAPADSYAAPFGTGVTRDTRPTTDLRVRGVAFVSDAQKCMGFDLAGTTYPRNPPVRAPSVDGIVNSNSVPFGVVGVAQSFPP